jgi:hypothetical protein
VEFTESRHFRRKLQQLAIDAADGYLYLYLQHVYLLILLDKNEQEDASEEQPKQMGDWAAQIKKDSGD